MALASAVPGEASLGNPVDLLGSATAATYEAVVPHVLADPNVDALIVIFVPPVVAGADEVAAAIRRAVEPCERKKPVVAVVISADGHAQRAVRARLAGGRASLSGIGRPRARLRLRTLRLARARAGNRTRARRRQRQGPPRRRFGAGGIPGLVAATPADPHAARGLRHPARRRADRAHRRRGRDCSPRARLPRRRQDGRAGSPQDRYRRRRARPSRRRPGTRRSRARSGCP